MRRGIVGLSLFLTFFLLPAYSATPIKAGSVCSNQGKTKTYQGKKYTCIKSGKILVWNKGVVLKRPTATPPPTFSPTPAPTPTTTLTSSFVDTSIVELAKDFDSIPKIAWDRSVAGLSEVSISIPSVSVLVGPQTIKVTPNVETLIGKVAAVLGKTAQPTSVTFVYFSYQDRAWAQSIEDKIVTPTPSNGQVQNLCATESSCGNAVAFSGKDGTAFIFLGEITPNTKAFSGSVETHEYTHSIQQHQYFGKDRFQQSWCCEKFFLPWYFPEGEASFIGDVALSSSSLSSFMNSHKDQVAALKFTIGRDVGGFDKFDTTYVQNYLNPKVDSIRGRQMWDTYPSNLEYSIGFFVTEYLVASRGANAVMQMRQLVAQGMEFRDAFNQTFGREWSEAVPILAAFILHQVK